MTHTDKNSASKHRLNFRVDYSSVNFNYKSAVEQLKKYAYHYYVLDDPITTDEEYDYLCETLSDEELSGITPEFKSISQIKKAISIVNTALQKKMSYNV